MTYPYNDEYMTYDYTRHRYVLTEKALFDELGINFGLLPETMDANPSTLAQRFAKSITATVYLHLYTGCMFRGLQEYQLATVPDLRNVIFDMLLAQARYVSGNGLIENYSGIDIYKGHHVPRYDIKHAAIAPIVEEMSYTILPCIGRALKYSGYLPDYQPSYVDVNGNNIY